jgi:hypothetical protein
MAIALCAMPAMAAVIHVPADFATIQQGIDASADGDTVLVAPGIYSENISYNGHDIVLRSQFGPDSTVLETPHIADNIPTVIIIDYERPGTALIGFTLRNFDDHSGLGASLTIDGDTSISGPLIYGNKFVDNWGHPAGANVIGGRGTRISNNVFVNNITDTSPGAMKIGGIGTEVDSNVFYNNCATQGAGIRAGGRQVKIHHNLIYSDSGASASGIFLIGAMGAEIYNNTIAFNRCT